jgi:hypothetical protein
MVESRIALVAALFLLVGCGSKGSAPRPPASGGSGATGGSSGFGGFAGFGGSGGSGGDPGSGGSGGSTPVAPPTDGPASDAPAATPDGPLSEVSPAPLDAAGGPILSCWPDPHVIMVCHQLENACENCGPNKGKPSPANPKAQPCFDLVEAAKAGKATDADCAKHAKDNDCTVDNVATTGNLCGSLTCDPATCSGMHGTDKNSNTCEKAKGWGDSTACAFWYAKCPCK